VLTDWVHQQERYEIISERNSELSGTDFDIIVLDAESLREHDTKIRERKVDATAFLPVLLVSSEAAANPLDTPDQPEAEPAVWQLVDERLLTPTNTTELRRRLDTLARIRTQSLALKRQTDQLLLLNRITRHDIRNEMQIISGWTDQLAAHTDDAGDQIRQRIIDSSQHVVDLTKAVREFVETLQTAGDPDIEPVDLTSVVTDELTKRRATFEDAEFAVTGELPQVDVRANDLLASVFRNLLNNAVQHNDSDTPRVEIAVSERDETVTITIADNGPGIPPEQREAVLGRTDEGLDHPAAGLGLYLVDTLVSQYGGTLQISDADLGGASIEIELPKASSTEVNTVDNDS
jgi:signal transduction histidine kinase